MLHAKFQDHRTLVSEEDFLKVLAIYGHGCHLSHITKIIFTENYVPSSQEHTIWL